MVSMKAKLLNYVEHHLHDAPTYKQGLKIASEIYGIVSPEYCTRSSADMQICFKYSGRKRSYYFRTKKECHKCDNEYDLNDSNCIRCLMGIKD
jgi:hypothetical protein